jgi:hypothetical protein
MLSTDSAHNNPAQSQPGRCEAEAVSTRISAAKAAALDPVAMTR